MRLAITLVVDLSVFDSGTGKKREPATEQERRALIEVAGATLAGVRTGLHPTGMIGEHLVGIDEIAIEEVKVS